MGGGNTYLVSSNGTGLTQLTFGPRADLPAFWQDGSKIAYYVSDVTHNQLYLMNLDGSGEVPLTPSLESGTPVFSSGMETVRWTCPDKGQGNSSPTCCDTPTKRAKASSSSLSRSVQSQ